jgi:hypothetical protein
MTSFFLREEIAIRRRADASLDALKPPTLLADVHELMVGISIRQLAAAEGPLSVTLGARSFDELQGTPDFEDTPWIPLEVSLAVRGALGCDDIQKT